MAIKVMLKANRDIGINTGFGDLCILEKDKIQEVSFIDEKHLNLVLDYKCVDLVATKAEPKKVVEVKSEPQNSESPKEEKPQPKPRANKGKK